jgi:single-stranded DNA-binding protein
MSWTAEDGSGRSVVEVVAEELGPSLRWATATTTRTTRNQSQQPKPTRRCDKQTNGSILASASG